MNEEVEVDCSLCNASGVYRAESEQEGIGDVCPECGGEGFARMRKFNGQTRATVQFLRIPGTEFLIPYEDFLAGKVHGLMPPETHAQVWVRRNINRPGIVSQQAEAYD